MIFQKYERLKYKRNSTNAHIAVNQLGHETKLILQNWKERSILVLFTRNESCRGGRTRKFSDIVVTARKLDTAKLVMDLLA